MVSFVSIFWMGVITPIEVRKRLRGELRRIFFSRDLTRAKGGKYKLPPRKSTSTLICSISSKFIDKPTGKSEEGTTYKLLLEIYLLFGELRDSTFG